MRGRKPRTSHRHRGFRFIVRSAQHPFESFLSRFFSKKRVGSRGNAPETAFLFSLFFLCALHFQRKKRKERSSLSVRIIFQNGEPRRQISLRETVEFSSQTSRFSSTARFTSCIHLSCAIRTHGNFVRCDGRPRLRLWKPQAFEKA